MYRGVEGRDAVIERMCTLRALVAKDVFNYEYAADCFCQWSDGNGGLGIDHWRDEEVPLAWLEDAVVEAVAAWRNENVEIVRDSLAGLRRKVAS